LKFNLAVLKFWQQKRNQIKKAKTISKEVQEKYMQELDTATFKSYGSTKRGYVLMPEEMWNDLDTLARYLNESYD